MARTVEPEAAGFGDLAVVGDRERCVTLGHEIDPGSRWH